MTSTESISRVVGLFVALLTLNSLTITGAEAQTGAGDVGTVPRPRLGLSKEEAAEAKAQWRARALAEGRRYKGTQVTPDPRAAGEALVLQTWIAHLFSAEDVVPEPRKERFRRMSENTHTPITGWYGTILDVTPDRGGVVVTVKVGPTSVGGFANLSTTTERYRFADGRFLFLDLIYEGRASTWN